ncbi:undecaprenyl-diphosphate phosphatase [Desulfobacterales bacterium HSG16]|nr:undecaprenyl-diphosphate phosphatase [Desulfobacterales bacterium HSG16]
MGVIQAVLLGIIQGLTEFLPVSSSGHLVLFQRLFGLTEPELFFDVSVHMGTLVAVLIFFRNDIFSIIRHLYLFFIGLFQGRKTPETEEEKRDLKLVVMIIAGSIPTGIIGLLLHGFADTIFSSIVFTGFMLLLTGTFLWISKKVENAGRKISKMTASEALLIGTVQGLAIMPGISRSGSTIVTGLFLGLSRETAARYSFLLSIPAIFGAQLLSIADFSNGVHHTSLGITLIGAVTAGIFGYAALAMLLFIMRQGKLYMFAPYCWILGSTAVIVGFF